MDIKQHFNQRSRCCGYTCGESDTVHEADTLLQICGPLWSDFRWWDRYERMFPIGRCQILPPSSAVSEGVLAYDVYRKYLADDEVEGKQLYYGMALFGFSAEGDGVSAALSGLPQAVRGNVSLW